MKPSLKALSGCALAVLVPIWLTVTPAAQGKDGERHAVPRERARSAGPSRPAPAERDERSRGDDERPAGRAVPRESPRQSDRRDDWERRPDYRNYGKGGRRVVIPEYYVYPWGYPGLGGYYDPYDPYYYGSGSYSRSYGAPFHGYLRLKMKPRDAAVFVDGYYVGVVDEFDGILQGLHIEWGPHRIEVRKPGYKTLALDVRIEADRTVTYRGDLRPLGP